MKQSSDQQYAAFTLLVDKQYSHCTLEEKLTVYLQHHPIRAVPFLKELILELYPDWKKEEPNESRKIR